MKLNFESFNKYMYMSYAEICKKICILKKLR